LSEVSSLNVKSGSFSYQAEEYVIPTTTPSVPTCYSDDKIMSSSTGAYIKSACYMKEVLLNQDQAAALCASMGKKLYTIERADEMRDLLNFVENYVDFYSWVLINGKYSNGAWSNSNPTTSLISAGQPLASYYVPEGGCLYATGQNMTRGGFCDAGDYLCEFIEVS
jgi:hypothetical protein